MMWGPFWGGMGWLWPLMMVLFWAAVIGLGVLLARALWTQSGAGETRHDSAEDTLKRRYASGDITREEYEEGLRILRR